MPARNTRPVRKLWDNEAVPPREYEAATASDHAMAYFMGGTYARPDHRDGGLTGTWLAAPHGAPADVVPAVITFDRSLGTRPFVVHGQQYRQLGDAMEAAVGA